jgi:1-acyl-sn-glycerol-3-phosphate acyltransferase
MYKDLNLPVTPVALNTGLIWKPKGLMRSPGHVTFKVLPPIPAGLPRAEFMQELERVIESECQALLPPDRRRSVAS